MSENDRMERAKRIRRMREGQRDEAEQDDGGTTAEESVDAAATEPEAAEATSTDGGSAATTADTDVSEETTGADETESVDEADASVDETGDSGSSEEGDVEETIENVSGTTAEVPSAEEMEAVMEQTMSEAEQVESTEEADAPAGPAGVAEASETTATQEADTRVLEFTLDDEQYCLDIEYIEEIVKQTHITRVPNTPDFVEGVVDLRGQITTILNPKVTIGKPDKSPGELIVVFDAEAFEDQGHIGWVVDDVRQVSPVKDEQVNDPPMQEDYINGVIDRDDDDQFVIWTTPELALDEAT